MPFLLKSLAAATLCWSSFQAFAQSPTPAQPVLGWAKSANLGANLSFSSSQDVVGQTNGTNQIYGLNLKSGFNRTSSSDEWRNTISYIGATTRGPDLPRFVKSSDELKVATIYLYSLPQAPQFGPYVSGEAAAPIFAGEDVRSAPVRYRVTSRNIPDQVFTSSSVRLSDGFKPLTTKEGMGGFWKAIQQETMKLEMRLGIAALQVNAAGQYAVQGLNKANEVQVNELTNIDQAGLEAGLSFKGKLNENSTYEVGAEAMTPFITNKAEGDSRSPLNLTNFDGFVKLSSNITSWASFGYDYKVKIQPQLVERAQQIHMLVINANYNLF